jgi:parvulin-like peptidyl-prolyl isomerase
MSELLQVNGQTIAAKEIIPLLAGYQMLPHLWREILIDQAIAPYTCTPEEKTSAYQQFCAQNQINSEASQQAWLAHHGMILEQLEALATRSIRIDKFKQKTWGYKLESYYLSRKSQLDKVVYSLIRVKDMGLAQELYFRIKEREQSFAEVAKTYSQGAEAQTNGLIGMVEMSTPNPAVAQLLSVSQPGQVHPPMVIGEWVVIVQMEQFVPSQLDEAMQQRLLNELFAGWLQEQLAAVSSANPLNTLNTTAK